MTAAPKVSPSSRPEAACALAARLWRLSALLWRYANYVATVHLWEKMMGLQFRIFQNMSVYREVCLLIPRNVGARSTASLQKSRGRWRWYLFSLCLCKFCELTPSSNE